MAAESGDFTLFALLLRANAVTGWDLVAAASWLDPSSLDSYRWLYGRLGEFLGPEEFDRLSRAVLLDQEDLRLAKFRRDRSAGLSPALKDFVFLGVEIRIGYFLACNAAEASVGHHVGKKRGRVRGKGS